MRRIIDRLVREERGDVPGWVLVTLMTAGPDLCVERTR